MAGLLDSLGMGAVDPNALAAVMPNPTINAPPSLLQRIAGGLGTFGNGLNTALTNNPLLDMGLGIMASAGQLGGGVGAGALQGMQAYRQQQAAQLQQQQLRQQLLMNQLYFRGLLDPQMLAAMGISSPGASSATGAAPSASAQGSGGLLGNAPAAPASPAVTPAPYLPPTPSAVGQSAQGQGVPGQPQSSAATPGPSNGELPSSLPNPWELYQRGVTLQRSMIPQYQSAGKAYIQQANAILQNDPRYVTARATAADPIAQDQALIAQAQQAGDTTGAAQLQQKLLQDEKNLSIGQYNGVRSWYDPAAGTWRSMSPTTGMETTGTQVSLAPGAAAALAQKQAAESLGDAAGKTIQYIDPATKQTRQMPLLQYLQQQGVTLANPAGSPASAAGATPGSVAALSPAESAQLTRTGEESGTYLSDLQTQADAAVNTNYSLDQMVAAGRNATLGPAADARKWAENGMAALGQIFGVTPTGKELSNYQMLDKYANQIAFAATRQMGSREAAQIVHLQMESNPNKSLMPQAFSGLVQSMRAMNAYVIAKNTAIQGVATDKASALRAASTWTSQIDPRVWDLSLGPDLASRFAGQIGAPKISTAIPFMANEDAVSVMRNLSAPMRTQVIRQLPDSVKQTLLTGLQQGSGATGTY